jgi:hypothetical protein
MAFQMWTRPGPGEILVRGGNIKYGDIQIEEYAGGIQMEEYMQLDREIDTRGTVALTGYTVL